MSWKTIQQITAPYLERFQQALNAPEQFQRQQLREILQANQHTEFGQRYRFSAMADINEFQERVPLHSYKAIQADVQRMAAGAQAILCRDAAIAFETTGGSSGGAKLIPQTAEGLRSVQRGILPWLGDLLTHRPQLSHGRAYWSISPATRSASVTRGGIPIGLCSDAAYFGSRLGQAIESLLAVPPEIAATTEVDAWRYRTVRALLATADLTFISVWSPTFLLQVMAEIKRSRDRLLSDLSSLYPQRVQRLKAAIRGDSLDTQAIWPKLDTISCWTGAAAHRFIPALRRTFPQAWIQGKGLLATEGVVTIPLVEARYPVLAVQSGFYEFIDPQGTVRLAHQLDANRCYRVVLTTAAGLYRYDLGDQVQVRGRYGQTPLLEFVGRAGLVSDLCGEKLTESFCLSCFERVRRDYAGDGLMTLVASPRPPVGYLLLVDAADSSPTLATTLAQRLDRELMANPQYAYARKLGQLAPLIPCRAPMLIDRYIRDRLEQGSSLGDIKPPVLLQMDKVSQVFPELQRSHRDRQVGRHQENP